MTNKTDSSKFTAEDCKDHRCRILFKGIVQGVGFRPFIYRSAKKFNLNGFVFNSSAGVIVEVEGKKVPEFVKYTIANIPPLAKIDLYKLTKLARQYPKNFKILPSKKQDSIDVLVPQDIALCANCRQEFFSTKDRRRLYPFVNCTDCGPRFTIIRDLPYDRPKTTMAKFAMCKACHQEYHNPLDRRYHAQPVSCFSCGPSLFFDNKKGTTIQEPMVKVGELLQQDKVVAIKGIGGYHLAARAYSGRAVRHLRRLKRRECKPFALMGTLEMIQDNCHLSAKEQQTLQSPAAPILLLEQKQGSKISGFVAPEYRRIGFMLPYSPLHLLLLDQAKEPLVMTSANFSDEPIIFKDNTQLLRKLSDHILSHDREIYIFSDDSVVDFFEDKPYMIRRSRGHVPFPVDLPYSCAKTILAVGPMLKTTFCFLHKQQAILSQYIGDTDSPVTVEAEHFAIQHFIKLFHLQPEIVAIDKHPQYPNRILADNFDQAQIVEIQHHKAHVAALLAENGEKKPIIGISMDGTGYGDDGNIWGGEIFVGDIRQMSRWGHLKYMFLPSGDQSAKEPWRYALSLLHSLFGNSSPTLKFAGQFGDRGQLVLEIINKQLNGILTSSCGRLFDAVSSLCNIGHLNHYEGQLPCQLQNLAESAVPDESCYSYAIENEQNCHILNYLPTIHDIIKDKRGVPQKAFIFHNTLAVALSKMADKARDEHNINTVGLTGGVFQNTLLLRLTKQLLENKGFNILIHRQVPPNDGGISLGQVLLAGAEHLKEI